MEKLDHFGGDIRLLTLAEAAELLQVSTRTLHRMIRAAELPAFKLGGQWRVRQRQLQQWIEYQESALIDTERSDRRP